MKTHLTILMAFTMPFFLLISSCEKENTKKENPTKATAKLPVTSVATGIDAIDIQFDYDGSLYILTPKCIKVFTNGKLKTLSLPDTVFSNFTTYDGWVYGPSQHISANRDGTIFLSRADGIRIVYKDGNVNTFVQGDIGWGIRNLEDLAITEKNEVFYAASSTVFKLEDRGLYGFGGILPYDHNAQFDFRAYTLDICTGNIFWLGTDKGIARAEETGDNNLSIKFIVGSNGTMAEGPVDKVKIIKVTQLEATHDGSVVYFIDQGYLKQLKNNIVKIITPMPDTRIALSKDGKKLYYIENGDLNAIDVSVN